MGLNARSGSDRKVCFQNSPDLASWSFPTAQLFWFALLSSHSGNHDRQPRAAEANVDSNLHPLKAASQQLLWITEPRKRRADHTVVSACCCYSVIELIVCKGHPFRATQSVIVFHPKESAILSWLLRVWWKVVGWIHPRPAPKVLSRFEPPQSSSVER